MSVVQFGENTVCIILEDKRYVIRELEVSEFMPNKTKFDSARIINAWKNHCLTEKNLFVRSSIYDNTAFTDSVSVEGA